MDRKLCIDKIMNDKLDLAKISLIQNSMNVDLLNNIYLENLILQLGMNIEKPNEQPEIVNTNGGGLYIWQYPNQFSSYIIFLNKYKIESYMEIGCRWGGTFILTTEYFSKMNKLIKSTAVDIINSPVEEYCILNNKANFIMENSQNTNFKNILKNIFYDIIFIDGDHSYIGVSSDFKTCEHSSNIFVFHDIVSDMCPGVVNFWNELKTNYSERFNFYEFTQQYDEVFNNTNKTFLGIGVAVDKKIDI
jgi:cephalosporin hydroxylase